jgi:hypothetical protein
VRLVRSSFRKQHRTDFRLTSSTQPRYVDEAGENGIPLMSARAKVRGTRHAVAIAVGILCSWNAARARAACPPEGPPSAYDMGPTLTQQPTLEPTGIAAVEAAHGRFAFPDGSKEGLATADLTAAIPISHAKLFVKVPAVASGTSSDEMAFGNPQGAILLPLAASTELSGFYRALTTLSLGYTHPIDRGTERTRIASLAALAYPFDRALYLDANSFSANLDKRWEVVGCHAPFIQLRLGYDFHRILHGDRESAARFAAVLGASYTEWLTLMVEYLLLVGLDFEPYPGQHALSQFNLGAVLRWRVQVGLWFALPVDGVQGVSAHLRAGWVF